MRAYIRHPAGVPIEFTPVSDSPSEKTLAQDVSLGGLSFSSTTRLKVGSLVKVRIPIVEPPFEAEAKVIWCLSRPDRYEAGIEFKTEQDAFSARMVEQICHIEHYRMWVQEVEGRDLDCEHAAEEWIGKFAEDFPNISG
ncbi:MAG: hypothetical protein ACI84K_000738 [Pseudohongiellaceae bacterium]|jgi:hypothetical protein